MRKMKAAHLPHSEVRVALRQFPVAGAELPDVVMTKKHTHTELYANFISLIYRTGFLPYPPSLSQSYTSIFIAL